MKYTRRPLKVEAISWGEMLAYGIETCGKNHLVNGFPPRFTYKGHFFKYRNEYSYVITGQDGLIYMTPDTMCIVDSLGHIFVLSVEYFNQQYQMA